MAISRANIHLLLTLLADQEGLCVNIVEASKSGVVVGLTTLAGALLFGNRGVVAGGALGGLVAYSLASRTGKLKPLSTVIEEMNPEKREALFDTIWQMVGKLDAQDCGQLLDLVRDDKQLKEKILEEITMFLDSNMNMAVTPSNEAIAL